MAKLKQSKSAIAARRRYRARKRATGSGLSSVYGRLLGSNPKIKRAKAALAKAKADMRKAHRK